MSTVLISQTLSVSLYSHTFHHWNSRLETKALSHGHSVDIQVVIYCSPWLGNTKFHSVPWIKRILCEDARVLIFITDKYREAETLTVSSLCAHIVPLLMPLVQAPLRRQMFIIKEPYYSTNLGFVLKSVVQCGIDFECPAGHKAVHH